MTLQSIQPNDRLLLAGKTGSGKTWFARQMLAGLTRLVVIDPKMLLGDDWNIQQPNRLDWLSLQRGNRGRFHIIPPIIDNLPLWYEELFAQLYRIGDLTIYIDETYAVSPPGSKPGKWLTALYTRGRELGIGVWAATQRPAWIPLFFSSEADWLAMFRLNLEVDRDRLSGIAGQSVLGRIPDLHGFWLYHVGDDNAVYYSEATEKERG